MGDLDCYKLHKVSTPECIPVQWRKPKPGFVKIITDGSAIRNPGQAGAGTVIRDHYGNWITGSYRYIPLNYGTLLLRFQQWTLNAMARKGSSFQTLSSSDSYLHADSCFICNGDLLSILMADGLTPLALFCGIRPIQ
ncbi:reverse transcriptase [Gossypium australe]|uniref:Reverse transcriptase n=1 Tax=Gossypium australe TaxID=47621 RepID=A0A5B6WNP5_9ROSI|nr:reverse transcriptase [Gossypium australe]